MAKTKRKLRLGVEWGIEIRRLSPYGRRKMRRLLKGTYCRGSISL